MNRNIQLPKEKHSFIANFLLLKLYKQWHIPGKYRVIKLIEAILGKKRLLLKSNSGFKILIDSKDLIQREVLHKGVYEPELTDFFSNQLKKNDVFWDIGANVGYYTLLACQKGCKSIYSFEPDPKNIEILKANLRINDFTSYAEVIPFGLSNQNEDLLFHRSHVTNTGVSGFIEPENIVSSFTVKVETIDNLIFTHKVQSLPTVVKIDVEGWEFKVLNGAQKLLSQKPPRIIVFEADVDSKGNIQQKKLKNYLLHFGYQIKRLQRKNSQIDQKENFIGTI